VRAVEVVPVNWNTTAVLAWMTPGGLTVTSGLKFRFRSTGKGWPSTRVYTSRPLISILTAERSVPSVRFSQTTYPLSALKLHVLSVSAQRSAVRAETKPTFQSCVTTVRLDPGTPAKAQRGSEGDRVPCRRLREIVVDDDDAVDVRIRVQPGDPSWLRTSWY
jgi:hypothetical protein